MIVAVQRVFRGFLGTIAVLLGLVIGTSSRGAGRRALRRRRDLGLGGLHAALLLRHSDLQPDRDPLHGRRHADHRGGDDGDVYATGEIVGKRIRRADIAAALRADGLATTIGGVLNSFPYTCFAENVGLVRLTQVKSRWVVALDQCLDLVQEALGRDGDTAPDGPGWHVGEGVAAAMIATIPPRGHFADASVAR